MICFLIRLSIILSSITSDLAADLNHIFSGKRSEHGKQSY